MQWSKSGVNLKAYFGFIPTKPSRIDSSQIHQTADFYDPDQDIVFRIKSLMGPGHYIMLAFVKTLILCALGVLRRENVPAIPGQRFTSFIRCSPFPFSLIKGRTTM